MSKMKQALASAALALGIAGAAQAQQTGSQVDATQDAVNASLTAPGKTGFALPGQAGGNPFGVPGINGSPFQLQPNGQYGQNGALAQPGNPFAFPNGMQDQRNQGNAMAVFGSITKTDIVTTDGTVIRWGVEFRNTGSVLQAEIGKEVFDGAAIVVKLGGGSKQREALLSLGFEIAKWNYLVLTHQHLQDRLKFQFETQEKDGWFKQVTDAAVWTWVNQDTASHIQYGKASAYRGKSDSQSFGMEEYVRTSGTLIELFEKEMRVAGMNKEGFNTTFGFQNFDIKLGDYKMFQGTSLENIQLFKGTTLSVGAGAERRTDDFLNAPKSKVYPTANIGVQHAIDDSNKFSVGVSGSSTDVRTTVGYTHRMDNGLNLNVHGYVSHGLHGTPDSYGGMVSVSGNFDFGSKTPTVKRKPANLESPAPQTSQAPELPKYYKPMGDGKYSVSASEYAAANGGVIPTSRQADTKVPFDHYERTELNRNTVGLAGTQFAAPKSLLDATFKAGQEPHIPKNVSVQKDTSVTAKLLVSIDTAGAQGATLDLKTGDISLPTSIALGTIESATNETSGQVIPTSAFSTNGATFIVHGKALNPYLAPGISTIKVLTTSASVTVLVEKGSVKVLSIQVESRGPASPEATGNDAENKIVPKLGTDTSKWEVATVKAGSTGQPQYVAFDPNATYPGNVTALLRVKANGSTPASAPTVIKFTNAAPTISVTTVSTTLASGVGGTIAAMGAVDGDKDALSYAFKGEVPAWVTIDSATSVVIVPKTLPVGEYTFTRVASDGEFTVTQTLKLKVTAQVVPAPEATADDAGNKIVPKPGTDTSKWEVSIDKGVSYVAFNSAAVYLGNVEAWVRVKQDGVVPASAPTKLNFTNSAPVFTSGASVYASFTTGSGGTIAAPTVTDADQNTIVFSLLSTPSSGVSINSSTGAITVSSSLSAGTYVFNRVASDGSLSSNQSITLVISNASDPTPTDSTNPTAVGETVNTAHNTPILVNVLANDSDNSGTVLLGTITNPVGGTFVVESGKIRFTPTSGFSGAASCTYQVKDPTGNVSTAVLTVNVDAAPVVDNTPPNTPTLTTTPTVTNQNSVGVEVNGEVGASIWVNGTNTGTTIGATGKATINLDTSGADGTKNFSITLKDNSPNANQSTALSVSIEKGTVAPASPVFASTAPDTKNTTYTNVRISADKSFAGASITVTSRNGGTISGVSINGSGEIVVASYATPNANPDYLDITGTDKFGNPINISRRTNLPNDPVAVDNTPPNTPTLTTTPTVTNQNSVGVEVNGEVGASIWVNGTNTGTTIGATGKATINLDTSGADGTKNFSITLKDNSPNANQSTALSVSIEKGTVAPASPVFASTAPDTKNTTYTNVRISADKSFAGASITVTSRNGGTISGVSINGSGEIVIASYATPNANPDYLDITGTDKFGNPINISRRTNLPNDPVAVDNTPPNTPTLTTTPTVTNQNSVSVEVNGEVGASVWVNGTNTGTTIGATGKATINLDTSGADGAKNFSITLKDNSPNANQSTALSVSIEKGTVAPSSVSFSSGVPDSKWTEYVMNVLTGDKSFAGANITVTSRNGGTISGVSINGSGEITIVSYTTPNANPDYLDITGTDKFGNTINIARRVNLPN